MANVLEVTEQTWQTEVLDSEMPVLVDFWAEWCGPCRQLAPTVEALAAQYAGRLKVAKLDVDRSGPVATRYGVQGIPALLLFRGGKVVDQIVGNQPKARIQAKLDQHLGAA